MKFLASSILMVIALSSVTFADQIYGSISIQNQAVQNAEIIIICGETIYRGSTDRDGKYRIYVKHRGKGSLSLKYRGKEGRSTVVSYDEPIRYDFQLVETTDGYRLVRR